MACCMEGGGGGVGGKEERAPGQRFSVSGCLKLQAEFMS